MAESRKDLDKILSLNVSDMPPKIREVSSSALKAVLYRHEMARGGRIGEEEKENIDKLSEEIEGSVYVYVFSSRKTVGDYVGVIAKIVVFLDPLLPTGKVSITFQRRFFSKLRDFPDMVDDLSIEEAIPELFAPNVMMLGLEENVVKDISDLIAWIEAWIISEALGFPLKTEPKNIDWIIEYASNPREKCKNYKHKISAYKDDPSVEVVIIRDVVDKKFYCIELDYMIYMIAFGKSINPYTGNPMDEKIVKKISEQYFDEISDARKGGKIDPLIGFHFIRPDKLIPVQPQRPPQLPPPPHPPPPPRKPPPPRRQLQPRPPPPPRRFLPPQYRPVAAGRRRPELIPVSPPLIMPPPRPKPRPIPPPAVPKSAKVPIKVVNPRDEVERLYNGPITDDIKRIGEVIIKETCENFIYPENPEMCTVYSRWYLEGIEKANITTTGTFLYMIVMFRKFLATTDKPYMVKGTLTFTGKTLGELTRYFGAKVKSGVYYHSNVTKKELFPELFLSPEFSSAEKKTIWNEIDASAYAQVRQILLDKVYKIHPTIKRTLQISEPIITINNVSRLVDVVKDLCSNREDVELSDLIICPDRKSGIYRCYSIDELADQFIKLDLQDKITGHEFPKDFVDNVMSAYDRKIQHQKSPLIAKHIGPTSPTWADIVEADEPMEYGESLFGESPEKKEKKRKKKKKKEKKKS
jgi:hypothetical protein